MAGPVSESRRLAQCTCAIIWCLLSGGPIFGFAALKPIFVNEHVYEYVCEVSTNPSSGISSYFSVFANSSSYFISSESTAKCTDQDLKLNMIFTLAAVLTNTSALVIGRVLDVYGPKVCGLIGAGFLYLASFVFIYAKYLDANTFIDPYLVGYAFMALGGPFAFISSFQLSNAFPHKSGIILALITGAFDASSAVFLIYNVFYIKSSGSFTISKFFQVYLLVPIFITLAQVTLMPNESYRAESEKLDAHEVDETSALLEAPVSQTGSLEGVHHTGRRDSIGDALRQPYEDEGEEYLVQHSGGVFGILHGHSAKFQLTTPWFYLMALFTTISMLRLNYFVATIGSQYTFLFGSLEKAVKLNKFFDVALPLGGLISVPFVGVFLDTCSSVFVLASTFFISLAIGILGLFGNYTAGLLNVALFVVYRPLFYTVVSDFCAKVFGFETFGTVYGTIMCFSGIFNFGQSILDKLTHTTFNMDPTPINLILIATSAIIGFSLIGYVKVQAKIFNESKKLTTR